MKPRVYYYAPAANDRLNAEHKVMLDIPALRNKVFGVCSALASVGQDAAVVSGVVPVPPSRALSRPVVATDNPDVPLILVPVLGSYVVKRITAGFSLLFFTMRSVRRNDRVILYNYFPEYLFSALWLRLVGNPAILDMEDGPIPGDAGLNARTTRLVYPLLHRLCARRRLIVSHQLARQLGYEQYLPVYGVASYFDAGASNDERFFGPEMHVLLGGSIMPGTGSDLFVETVRLLGSSHPDVPLHFHVTGFYDEAQMAALAAEVAGRGKLRLTLHGLTSRPKYMELAKKAAIGLNLRLPSHSYGMTTFPSKVVEIAGMGMLLLTTDVSDVRLVFGDEGAVTLRSETAEELAQSLLDLERDRAGAARVAAIGQDIVASRLSSNQVGKEVRDFLFDEDVLAPA